MQESVPHGNPTASENHHTASTKPKKPPREENWRSIATTLLILLIAPLVAILLTAFVFQSYQVDGPSMQTTLSNNDRLIVWKLPRSWARITGHDYVPKRGDIVIFNESNLGSAGDGTGSKQLIKRVIGLPGERVTIQNGKYVVYNAQHPNGFGPDQQASYGKVIGDTEPETNVTSWNIGSHSIFVSGDNRPDSLDSRYFDTVPLKDVVGKLSIRVLPISQAKRF
ncbi:MAG TPA: signal peptidase I [Candidatus Saccharimonadales bacterium]|nr:signal peptidase I [Candidatus Saccharimonadales bacterium]